MSTGTTKASRPVWLPKRRDGRQTDQLEWEGAPARVHQLTQEAGMRVGRGLPPSRRGAGQGLSRASRRSRARLSAAHSRSLLAELRRDGRVQGLVRAQSAASLVLDAR